MMSFEINNESQKAKLNGSVTVSGAKNSAIPIIIATLMLDEEAVLSNIPLVGDVKNTIALIETLGSSVEYANEDDTLIIHPKLINTGSSPQPALTIRSSLLLLGVCLARNKELKIPIPGGCRFGPGPIDIHIKSLRQLGANIELGKYYIALKKRIFDDGEKVVRLRLPSVPATMNIVLGFLLFDGEKTVIQNAAREPEVVDLCNFLNTCGAEIMGIGSDVLTILGVKKLYGCRYSIIPDRIEASTFILASVVTNSEDAISNVEVDHIAALIDLLENIGVKIDVEGKTVRVNKWKKLTGFEIETNFYPGLPTDIQPILTVLGLVTGKSFVTEKVYKERLTHINELRKLGADISLEKDEHVKTILKKSSLSGNKVRAFDIRAGAALLLASLITKGKTVISGIEQIDRGYKGIDDKFKKLGVDIKRVLNESVPIRRADTWRSMRQSNRSK